MNELTVRGMQPVMARYSYYPKMVQPAAIAAHTDREIYDDIRSELFWTPRLTDPASSPTSRLSRNNTVASVRFDVLSLCAGSRA